MCPVLLRQQPQVCNRLCFLDIFSTLQVTSICSDPRESWWHHKDPLECWTTQTCDSNDRGHTEECLGRRTENKTNWSNGARTQTGMFYCAFQWHADSKIQSSIYKCVFRYSQSNVPQLLPASDYCHSLFCFLNCAQWFDYCTLSSSRKLERAAEHFHWW